jgi:hypothetical protein
VTSLARLPDMLLRALDDVHAMAQATTVLPAILERLSAIEDHVVSLDAEVALMRAHVQEIDGRLVGVRAAVDPLAAEFQGVLAAVAPLGPELELVRAAIARLELPLVDVHSAVAPLGEAAARVGGLTGRLPGSRRRSGPPTP